MKTANRTDIGHIRTVNEDRVAIQTDLNGFTFAMVADGMGGHQAGDIASQMAIDIIQEQLKSLHMGLSVEECEAMIKQATDKANEEIYNFAFTNPACEGMGTTVVLAVATSETVIIAHIGDSRVYKFSEKSMIQLTEDHSLVTELVKSGQISVEEASFHPRRNVLTRALGTEQTADVDIHHIQWVDQDLLLLCSDGLSGSIDDQQIMNILGMQEDLDWKVDQLVTRALEAGGEDNISIVLLSNERQQDRGTRWND